MALHVPYKLKHDIHTYNIHTRPINTSVLNDYVINPPFQTNVLYSRARPSDMSFK